MKKVIFKIDDKNFDLGEMSTITGHIFPFRSFVIIPHTDNFKNVLIEPNMGDVYFDYINGITPLVRNKPKYVNENSYKDYHSLILFTDNIKESVKNKRLAQNVDFSIFRTTITINENMLLGVFEDIKKMNKWANKELRKRDSLSIPDIHTNILNILEQNIGKELYVEFKDCTLELKKEKYSNSKLSSALNSLMIDEFNIKYNLEQFYNYSVVEKLLERVETNLKLNHSLYKHDNTIEILYKHSNGSEINGEIIYYLNNRKIFKYEVLNNNSEYFESKHTWISQKRNFKNLYIKILNSEIKKLKFKI